MIEVKINNDQLADIVKLLDRVIVSAHQHVITPILYVTFKQFSELEKLGIIKIDGESE